jgi:hypothetical protein
MCLLDGLGLPALVAVGLKHLLARVAAGTRLRLRAYTIEGRRPHGSSGGIKTSMKESGMMRMYGDYSQSVCPYDSVYSYTYNTLYTCL